MRHPFAPLIVTLLVGGVILLILWNWVFEHGRHHEGNPHEDDVPMPVPEVEGGWEDEEEGEGEGDGSG